MIIRTRSATPLIPIVTEDALGGGQHVWLRTNITETTSDDGPAWEADEVYIHLAEAREAVKTETGVRKLAAAQHVVDLERRIVESTAPQVDISALEDAFVEWAPIYAASKGIMADARWGSKFSCSANGKTVGRCRRGRTWRSKKRYKSTSFTAQWLRENSKSRGMSSSARLS